MALTAIQILSAYLIVVTLAAVVYKFLKRSSTLPLPPGPKPWPIIGNALDLPPAGAKEWLHWMKHKDLYGPISSVTVFGQTLVIINDHDVAVELLDKRSATNSSRPNLVFGGEMCGWEDGMAMLPYSTRFRAYRKAANAELTTAMATDHFKPTLEVDVRRLLLRILNQPQDLRQLIRIHAGRIILRITYGYEIEPHTADPLVDLAEETIDQFCKATVPGAWVIDLLPFLRYLPDWLVPSKRTARHYKATLYEFVDKPYQYVRNQIRNNRAAPSYLSQLLKDGDLSGEAEHVARWSAASMYGGGADTTVSSMACFFLAMMLYPDVQRKAKAELDSVCGSRLPTFADRESLPYIDAIVKELLRWHPVGPMGLPHLTTQDDTYDKYFIPKGSIILPNVYWMLHDPAVYHDPYSFKPERFLGDHPESDSALAFGFGRRKCPGKTLADASLYNTIAATLAVFDISKPEADGTKAEPAADFLPGIISHPATFDYSIKPRSEVHEDLIRSVEIEYPTPEHGDARYLDLNVGSKA